jgi:hypothetical protein
MDILMRPVPWAHGGVAADLDDDAGYAPRRPHFDAHPAAIACWTRILCCQTHIISIFSIVLLFVL